MLASTLHRPLAVGIAHLCPARSQLKGLANGYHLMRAFVIDATGASVKSPLAYVEAEFFAVDTTMPEERCVDRQTHPRHSEAALTGWWLCG